MYIFVQMTRLYGPIELDIIICVLHRSFHTQMSVVGLL